MNWLVIIDWIDKMCKRIIVEKVFKLWCLLMSLLSAFMWYFFHPIFAKNFCCFYRKSMCIRASAFVEIGICVFVSTETIVYSSQCSVVSCDISPSQLSQRISPPSFLFAKPHHKNHLLFLALFFFAWIFGSYIHVRAVWRMTVNVEKIKDKMLS